MPLLRSVGFSHVADSRVFVPFRVVRGFQLFKNLTTKHTKHTKKNTKQEKPFSFQIRLDPPDPRSKLIRARSTFNQPDCPVAVAAAFARACVVCVTAPPARKAAATIPASTSSVSVAPAA